MIRRSCRCRPSSAPESELFDVAVIGAGVVGAAIARELAQYRLRCVAARRGRRRRHRDEQGQHRHPAHRLRRQARHARGAPGAARPRAAQRLRPEAGIPIEPLGALLVAWDAEQLAALPASPRTRRATATRRRDRSPPTQLYRVEPHLGPGALGALRIPDESIICPFTTPLAFATEAVLNGVALSLDSAVHRRAQRRASGHALRTPRATLRARYVVNAAGLYADAIDRLLRPRDVHRDAAARRADRLRQARPAAGQPHPAAGADQARPRACWSARPCSATCVLGPTAEDIDDKTRHRRRPPPASPACSTRGARILPALLDEEVTAVYVGLRAATEHGDYQIAFHPAQRYVCVGGIRSTGLSASMAIAEYVVDGLRDAGLGAGAQAPTSARGAHAEHRRGVRAPLPARRR